MWRTPMFCACGATFAVDHALSCPKGGFPIARHNEICDITADLLTQVCQNVRIEPQLQPLTGEVLDGASSNTSGGARLDIAVNELWRSRFERAFLDVRVFNSFAPSNKNTSISYRYQKHKLEKRRVYDQCILEVEHLTFTPLVFSASGGMAKLSSIFYKRLVTLLADKWEHSYTSNICWLCCRISFCLLHSAIRCIRGARSSINQPTSN